MILSTIKYICTGELKFALKKARKNERKKCKKENRKKMHRVTKDVEKFYNLKLQEVNAEMDSLISRMAEMEKRESKSKARDYEVKEIGILQRRIASDLVYLQEIKRTDEMEYLQKFTSILAQQKHVERKMIGLDK